MTNPTSLDRIDAAAANRPAAKTVAVLHVINGEHFAGAERVQDLLARNLGDWGYQVGLACLKPGLFASMRQATDAPLYNLPMAGRLDLSVAWKLAKLVRREGYQLIHSHTARSALVASLASKWTGVPMVHHVHSPTGCDTTHRWRNRLNRANRTAGARPGDGADRRFRSARTTRMPRGFWARNGCS